jgi:hypothetical protein
VAPFGDRRTASRKILRPLDAARRFTPASFAFLQSRHHIMYRHRDVWSVPDLNNRENMNIYVRDASSGATIAAMSADMRGNTDESWSRTLDWLVRNRLLAPNYGLQ